MENMKAKPMIKLPQYSKMEDAWNKYTHFVGAIIGVVALVAMLVISVINTVENSKYFVDIISAILFGGALTMLYGMSTMYHGEKNLEKRIIRQKFDHLSINILIAGSASAILISGLRNTLGYCLIAGIWALSILSMVLNSVNVKKFRAVTMIIYILTGWSPIFIANILVQQLGWTTFGLILGGGLAYTFGLIFYAIKKPYMHVVWHFFVLTGSLFHIVAVIFGIML